MQRRDWHFCFPTSPDSRSKSAVVQLSTLDGAHHDMLCEICHQREATCHINTIKDGVVTSKIYVMIVLRLPIRPKRMS